MQPPSAPPPRQEQSAKSIESQAAKNFNATHEAIPAKTRSSSLIKTLVGVAAAVALGVAAFTQVGTSGPADQVSQRDLAQIQASWTAATQTGIVLDRVEAKDQAAAIKTMNLPAEQEQQIQTAVSQGQTDLVWFRVWDNLAEDGDVIALNSDGLRVVVPIRHGVTTVALPKPAGGTINIEGVRDGGGGITLGIYAGQSPVLVPPMAPGQKLGIPVR